MTTVREPWAEPIESLPIIKRDPSFFNIEEFWLNKNKEIFPYLKEDIKIYVNPYKPFTFLPILQELDMPFYEERWIQYLRNGMEKGCVKNTIGKYINFCKLFDVKGQGFQNSSRIFEDRDSYFKCEYIVYSNAYVIML